MAEKTKEKVKIAWDKAFPTNDFSWFQRYLDWADLKMAAVDAGMPAPELSESAAEDDDDDGQDDASS